jgi:hypothetical protein
MNDIARYPICQLSDAPATAVYTCGYQAYLRATALPTTSVRWTERFFRGYQTPLRVANGVGFIISGRFHILDTPHGLKPDGCSEHAPGAPSRSPPKSLPDPLAPATQGRWTSDAIARRARIYDTAGSSGAYHVSRTEALVPMGTLDHGTRTPAWGVARCDCPTYPLCPPVSRQKGERAHAP